VKFHDGLSPPTFIEKWQVLDQQLERELGDQQNSTQRRALEALSILTIGVETQKTIDVFVSSLLVPFLFC
jgi:hypothetical protein